MFEEKYAGLSNAEKRIFTQNVGELLFDSFIVRKKYDRTVGLSKINATYLFIEKHFEMFEDYVNYAGYDLVKDEDSGVIYLYNSDGANRLRLDTVTTLLVYALRYHYEESLKSNNSQTEVLLDSVSLKLLIKDLSLNKASKRISAVSIAASLRFLAQHNIVARAQHGFSDPSYSFYILPSIRYIIDSLHMNALANSIKENEDSTGNSLESETNNL